MAAFLVNEMKDGSDSLQALKTLLTTPAYMQSAINKMCQSDAWDGILSRLGHGLTHFKDKELGSVLTTTSRHLRFLNTLPVAENTKKSSFDPVDLTRGKMTVYLLLPSEYLRSHAALLRM